MVTEQWYMLLGWCYDLKVVGRRRFMVYC